MGESIDKEPDIEQVIDDDLYLYFNATAIQRASNSTKKGKKCTKAASK